MTTSTRRRVLRLAAVASAAALAVGACSTEGGPGSGGGGGNGKSGDGQSVDTLNMTMTAATATFVRNWNAFAPVESTSPGTPVIYEPLVRVNHLSAKQVEPWLADSFEWNDDYTKLTFKLRDDVTWSDGEPFTSADVAFTFNAPDENEGLAISSLGYESLETPDDHTVVINYAENSLQQLPTFADRRIYPAHIWEEQDLLKWTNPEPVGTGPAVLEKFSPQQVTLSIRDDYWNGDFKAVEKINVKPYASPEAGKAMLLDGSLDWSTMNWVDAEEQFVGKDPENNHYWTFATGGTEGLNFNTARPPLDDVHVRRALKYAIDPEALLSLSVTGQGVANPTGFANMAYSELLAPDFQNAVVTQDLEMAQAELAESEYELNDKGHFTKDGETYPLTIKPVNEYSNWTAWGRGLSQQWEEELGVKVEVKNTPEDQMWSQYEEGDYLIGLDWQAGGNSPWNGYDGVLHSRHTAPLGEAATTNYTRWQDDRTDELLDEWRKVEDLEEQKEYAHELQEIVVDQVPFAPLFDAAWFVDVNSSKWKGWPTPEDGTFVPQPGLGPDTIRIIQNLEPAS